MTKIIYEDVVNKFKKYGMTVLTPKSEYKNTKQKLIVTNGVYKAVKKYESLDTKQNPYWFSKRNPYTIYNINQWLLNDKHSNFICCSTEFIDRDSDLDFKCSRCGEHIYKSWFNAYRNDCQHLGLSCPNCDGNYESLHAIILKQIFIHEYPDTVVEDPSCINPNTNSIMATDIVNHRLKVAIEIQGQYHNREDQKKRDKIKKKFWIDKGYNFYDYSIDKVSIIDYIRLFFPNVKEIPEYIDYNYCSKLNLKVIQAKLDNNDNVIDIAHDLSINPHRIYDAIYENKLHYSDTHKNASMKSVIQVSPNGEFIEKYESIKQAENDNNITHGNISSCIYYNGYFSSGYYWFYEDDYNSGKYQSLMNNRTAKFYVQINKYNMNDEFIKSYNTVYDASNDNNVIAYKILENAIGIRKSINGNKYRFKNTLESVETTGDA